jgi:hypothetical protein
MEFMSEVCGNSATERYTKLLNPLTKELRDCSNPDPAIWRLWIARAECVDTRQLN